MKADKKKALLLKKFTSIEYMQELEHYFGAAINGLYESIDYFYKHPPKEDWQSWHISSRPEGWEKKAIPNFLRIHQSIIDGIKDAKNEDFETIEDVTGTMRGLSKDMDVLGWEWWDYVADEVATKFGENLTAAEQISDNIYFTVAGSWKDDEILDEEITGPIDEAELLKYVEQQD